MEKPAEEKEEQEITFLFWAVFGSLVVIRALQYMILSNLSKVNIEPKI